MRKVVSSLFNSLDGVTESPDQSEGSLSSYPGRVDCASNLGRGSNCTPAAIITAPCAVRPRNRLRFVFMVRGGG